VQLYFFPFSLISGQAVQPDIDIEDHLASMVEELRKINLALLETEARRVTASAEKIVDVTAELRRKEGEIRMFQVEYSHAGQVEAMQHQSIAVEMAEAVIEGRWKEKLGTVLSGRMVF
jgi:hypothetical protein